MQTALITGSSRGIGRACARSLKDAGYDVVVHCRERAAEAEALAMPQLEKIQEVLPYRRDEVHFR